MYLRVILAGLLLLVAKTVVGQPYPTCTYTYFKGSRKVASSQCFDKDGRFGEAKAFARNGQEIYRHGLRTIGGHESVAFRFYPSGAVQQAYMSSAPDGGIQWYRSTTQFSETGEVTSVQEDSHDRLLNGPGYVTTPGPYVAPVPPRSPPATPKPAPATPPLPPNQCAALLQAECWFVNRSGRVVQVVVRAKSSGEQYLLRLPSSGRDTLKSHAYLLTQTYQTPQQLYTFAAISTAKGVLLNITPLPKAYRDLNANQRRYYFVVR